MTCLYQAAVGLEDAEVTSSCEVISDGGWLQLRSVGGGGGGGGTQRHLCVCVCVHVCMCACMCACVLQRKAKKERDCVLLPTIFPEGLPVADAQ